MFITADSTIAPKTIYHYTSQEGLLGIIQSTKLWASSIRHLNDAAELNYATELIENRLESYTQDKTREWKEFTKRIPRYLALLREADCHVGSFSQEKDQLGQWRAYTGGGAGFSIGFDFVRMRDFARAQGYKLVRCVYSQQEHDEMSDAVVKRIREVLQSSVEDALAFAAHQVLQIGTIVKHPAFAEEREWRITREVDLEEATKFRTGKSMLIPYGELIFQDENHNTPIVEIVVGPTPHMELSKRSLERLLISRDMAHVPIVESSVPFRNW